MVCSFLFVDCFQPSFHCKEPSSRPNYHTFREKKSGIEWNTSDSRERTGESTAKYRTWSYTPPDISSQVKYLLSLKIVHLCRKEGITYTLTSGVFFQKYGICRGDTAEQAYVAWNDMIGNIKFGITILSTLAFVCLSNLCFCVLKNKFLNDLEMFFENTEEFLGSQTQRSLQCHNKFMHIS